MPDFENMKKDDKPDKHSYTNIHLRIPDSLIKEIDGFSEDYNFMNRTDAVRFLISKGLKDFQTDK